MLYASIEDVADLAASLAWPLVALILVLALRPALTHALERGTLQKIGIGPFSVEFAAATAYQPTTQAVPLIDASRAPAIESYVPDIVAELEGPNVDSSRCRSSGIWETGSSRSAARAHAAKPAAPSWRRPWLS